MGNPSAVLFACTWNAIRSAMAESMLKHLQGDRIYVDSVGCAPGIPIPSPSPPWTRSAST